TVSGRSLLSAGGSAGDPPAAARLHGGPPAAGGSHPPGAGRFWAAAGEGVARRRLPRRARASPVARKSPRAAPLRGTPSPPPLGRGAAVRAGHGQGAVRLVEAPAGRARRVGEHSGTSLPVRRAAPTREQRLGRGQGGGAGPAPVLSAALAIWPPVTDARHPHP